MLRSLAVLLLVLALVAVFVLWRRQRPAPPPAPVASPPTQQLTTATPAPSPTLPPFRLAGVASGGKGTYAVIEDPQGVTALYRLGETVAGLGRLAVIEPQQVRVETDGGTITMRLQPAPTKTPAPTATPGARGSPTGSAPRGAASPAGTAPGSSS